MANTPTRMLSDARQHGRESCSCCVPSLALSPLKRHGRESWELLYSSTEHIK